MSVMPAAARLFLPFFFLLVPSFVKGEALALITESFPETPVSGSLWTFTILADHPRPDEVTVRPPVFPPGFSPETVRISLRYVRPEGAGSRARPWTEIQYRFAVRGRGPVILGAFTVNSGGKTGETPPVTLDVAGADGDGEEVFVWEGPGELAAGEEALFTLRSHSRLLDDVDGAAFLAGPLPRGAILERFLPGGDSREGGAVLCIRVIPLEGPVFFLPAFRFSAGTREFTVPALRVPVRERRR
ncbi:MAG: hypothetical protein LBL44_03915 [Treponema sp.]|nr:hypothetical protein [Treponema sp.]